MSRLCTNFLILSLVFIARSAVAHFQETDNNIWQKPTSPQSKNAILSLSPSICVVEEQGKQCQQDIQVKLALPEHRHVCIYQTGVEAPLWCHSAVRDAAITLSLASDKNINLFAKDEKANKVLANAGVSVSFFQPATKRKRRRYGLGLI